MWLYRVSFPGVPGGVWRIAPRGGPEDVIGDPIARWPIQGRNLLSELGDAGGWLDVAEGMVASLVPEAIA